MYDFHYNHRLVSRYKGSSLYFGSALDAGINELLLGKSLKEAKSIFIDNWTVGKDNDFSEIQLKENEDIVYSASDFDRDLLSESDEVDEEYFDQIKEKKSQVGWPNLESEERKYFNRVNWICLLKKGLIMIEAYKDQLLPKFKKVLAIQKQVELKNDDGDSIIGYVDLIAELHDGRIAVIDNKSAAREYDEDSVTKSPQLSLYKTILNETGEFNVTCAGFAILLKNLDKTIKKTCNSCDFVAEKGSTHKTCYAEIGKKRCGGEWTREVEFEGKSQFVLDEISDAVENMVLENINVINTSIKNDIYPRNFNNCKTKYGTLCPYYQKCWHGNDEELIQLPIKKEEK